MTAPQSKNSYIRHSAKVIASPRWKALRFQALRRDNFRCIECGANQRLEVDHVVPVRDAPARAFDLANLQTLCCSCHAKKTRRECGLPQPNPDRIAWREAVRQLTKQQPKNEV